MDNENITKTALKKANKYIKNRMNGMNKKQSALNAGYSLGSIQVAEQTKAYKYALELMLEKTSNITGSLLTSMEKDIKKDALKDLNLKEKSEITKRMAEVHKILTPQITVKEETNKDGSTKVTKWATLGAPQSSQDEHIDGSNEEILE